MNFGFEKFDANREDQSVKGAFAERITSLGDGPAGKPLPPLPPNGVQRFAEALATRLSARRWLILAIALIMFGHVAFAGLSFATASIAFAVLAVVSLAISAIGPHLGLSPPPQEDHSDKENEEIVSRSFQTIVDSLPDPAIMLSAQGTIVHYNALAADLLGDLQLGQHISSVIRNPEFLDTIARAKNSVSPLTVYYNDRVPIGRRISAVIAAIAPQTDEPQTARLLATFKDLTEQERINQMRADFISYASHELRTPLASLQGFIETLQGPAKDDAEARDRFLAIMAMQAHRMTRLINDLLSLSRAEMNAHLLPGNRVDINETVAYVVDTMEPIARDAEISLTLEPLSGPVYIRGERDELVQVFQNLIQNALKYGTARGHVDVRLERRVESDGRNPMIAISVEDDGPGISPEHLPRLTERFYRVDAASSREKGGTGLGLAIVKHIVNRHRGELQITSVPRRGSKFTVLLKELPTAA